MARFARPATRAPDRPAAPVERSAAVNARLDLAGRRGESRLACRARPSFAARKPPSLLEIRVAEHDFLEIAAPAHQVISGIRAMRTGGFIRLSERCRSIKSSQRAATMSSSDWTPLPLFPPETGPPLSPSSTVPAKSEDSMVMLTI